MKLKKKAGLQSIPIDMTPMIDIVFQLMTFFVMTLKIIEQEGDFSIKMPLAAPRAGLPDPHQVPPMKVRLRAGVSGRAADISLNDRSFSSWRDLHNYVAGVIGDERGPGSIQETAEVELDCDYSLNYEEVINAITAVSGTVAPDGTIIKLVEKIKFAPPRAAGG